MKFVLLLLINIKFVIFLRILSDHQIASNLSDDMGWKSKLKLPPKDNRFKTTVSCNGPFI